jgi:hypothetical protein
MTDSTSTRRIPASDIERLTIEIMSANVLVRWVDSGEDIVVSDDSVTVDRAGDELFIRSELPGLSLSKDDFEIRISGFESPGKAIEEILARTGVLSGLGFGSPSAPSGETLTVDVPRSIPVVLIEVELGDLRLENPHGRVECKARRGEFSTIGGDATLDVSAGSGSVTVDQLRGALSVVGGSGDIALTDVDAITNVKAGSGQVTLSRVRGEAIKLLAGSGDISVRHSHANAYSSDCGSGDVTLEGGRLERIAVRTGSGDLKCSATFGPHSQSFMTGSGTITLGIPRDLSARIEAFTSGGDIETELPLVSVGQRGPRSRRSRRQVGSVGSGEPRADVSLRTSSGDIRINWLPTAATDPIPMPASSSTESSSASVNQLSGQDEAVESATGSDDDWRSILESLQNGEISIEEAEVLLQTIEPRE